MAIVRPFRALLPKPDLAAQIASLPYDVVTRDEAARLAKGNPLSFLHISRSEIDLPRETSPYAKEVYTKARENFSELLRRGALVRESAETLYIYQLQMGVRKQTGILGGFSLDEYESGKIRKHEITRSEKEDDRTRHLISVQAHTGLVFLCFKPHPGLSNLLHKGTQTEPTIQFTATDQVRHALWRVELTKVAQYLSAFAEIESLYIADGHHRAASACRARRELYSKTSGNPARNSMLATAFSTDELEILPYHRAILDFGPQTKESFEDHLTKLFEVKPFERRLPPHGSFNLYFGGKWQLLRPRAASKKQELSERLDVSLLQTLILEPILGIDDPRTNPRIDFVGGIRGLEELESQVRTGRAVAAFALAPTQMPDLLETADQGKVMPPKSTWFEPKLRDGLACWELGDA